MFGKAIVRGLPAVLFVCWAAVAQADVFNMPDGQTSLRFVPVGNPGNAADTTVMTDGSTGYGSVPYRYQMGKYDVTVGQYCKFLNAVAQTDNYGLYSGGMAQSGPSPTYPIGITQSGNPGSYSYLVTGSYGQAANCPIFFPSWGSAARFCNWLQNGQPTGPEGNGTTETGAYTLNGATMDGALIAITRNAGAKYFIPSENEWYKAAYYDPTLNGGTGGYWTYPTKSNTVPSNILSSTGTNNVNFNANFPYSGDTDPVNHLTPVGAFANSPGPYGTYDMGGDVFQWNEASTANQYRGFRGGTWNLGSDHLASSCRYDHNLPSYGIYNLGFRVASVPEPGSIILLVSGAIAGLIWWRRRR
jgi:formylglycine-generating enzyme